MFIGKYRDISPQIDDIVTAMAFCMSHLRQDGLNVDLYGQKWRKIVLTELRSYLLIRCLFRMICPEL